ncbi:hypothetical protein OG601_43525 [Streptomyces sp. NBC_01239]|nr:hypothetical protein [Streptomyces sp. NBC_01239]MCX4817473.1 hypothetical protein [Streptomyces sp. NBC_01239]
MNEAPAATAATRIAAPVEAVWRASGKADHWTPYSADTPSP